MLAIAEQLGPRFAPGASVLYVGDTALKHIVYEAEELKRIGVPITEHDKLPDVVFYWPEKKWLYLIEAVTSHGAGKDAPELHGATGVRHGLPHNA